MGHRPARGRRGVRDLAGRDRAAGKQDPAPRPGRQLLAHGRTGPRRAVLGDLLRPRPGIRPRRRPRGGRGPFPRGLEPGVHAGPAERGPGQGRLRHRGPAAVQERRHRDGPGTDGLHPARGRQHLRDRHHVEDPGPGGGAHRAGVRPGAAGRRGAPRGRRPRAQRGDADRGRGLPSNEGRGYVLRRIVRRSIRNLRLLAGSQRGGGAANSGSERYMHELTSVAIEAMGRLYPELHRDAANIRTVIDAEETAFASTLRTGTAIFDASVEENRRRNSRHAVRRPGLPAARHLRLPDRPDPGDGGGAGPDRRRGRVPPAHGRAAGPREAGRGREEDRQRRHLGVRRDARAVRRGHLHRLRPDLRRGDDPRPAGQRRCRWPRRARARK